MNMNNLHIQVPINEKTIELSINSETPFGEPTIWVYLSDESSIEITHEENGLPEIEQFFSVRRHCSDEDFDEGKYHDTCGVIETLTTQNSDKKELVELLSEYLTALSKNGIYIIL